MLGKVTLKQEDPDRGGHCSQAEPMFGEAGLVSSLSPPSTQAHLEQETSIASLFFSIKPIENE